MADPDITGNISSKFAGMSVNTSGSGLSGFAGAASGLAIAAYLVAVIYQGNLDALGASLMKEEAYLEFLIAIVLILALAKYGPTSRITDFLVVGALLGVALKVAANVNFTSALANFATGKATMLKTVQALMGHTTG